MNVSSRPFNKYIAYLTVYTFLALYIICFVFLFNNNNEIIGFGFLTLFSIFFIFFIIDTIGSHLNNFNITFVTGYMWFILFSSMALNLSALILILMMFSSVYKLKNIISIEKKENSVKNIKSNIPPKYLNMINDFKIIFILNITFVLMLLFFVMYNYSNLNTDIFNSFNTFMEMGTFDSFKPLIAPLFTLLIGTRLLFTSSYEVYIGNELYKMNKKRVIYF
jgi:hypothetical protein